MCRRLEALDAIIQEAHDLRHACNTFVMAREGLRLVYDRVAEQPVPDELEAELSKLGATDDDDGGCGP